MEEGYCHQVWGGYREREKAKRERERDNHGDLRPNPMDHAEPRPPPNVPNTRVSPRASSLRGWSDLEREDRAPQQNQHGQILKEKIELLNKTNMVDYAMDIHKSLYHTEDVPQDMIDRRVEVVARLKALEEAAPPLVAFLQNPNAVQEHKADKQYNLQMLIERYQIGTEQIEAL